MRPVDRATIARAAVVALVGSIETAAHADAISDAALEAAEQAYADLDYASAIRHADEAIAHGALGHAALVRAYRVSAVSHAALEQSGPAKDAFRKLLTIDPEYELDRALSPKVQTPYFEARGDWRAELVHPGLDVTSLLAQNEPGTLRVTTRGFAGLVKEVVVGFRWGLAGQPATMHLAPSARMDVPVPAPPLGTSRCEYWVQALDEHDDVLFEVGNPLMPKTAFLPAPQGAASPWGPTRSGSEAPLHQGGLLASPVFWTVAAVVVVGAGVGTYFALAKRSPSTVSLSPAFGCTSGLSGSCN
jgi:hypothetical protein